MPLPERLPSATNRTAESKAALDTQKPKEILANRYIVERTLGSGNCGTALLVTDRKDKNEKEKQKVIKKVFIGGLQPDETVDAEHEAALIRSLDHPNIIRFFDCFVEYEYFCIVTEFCDDGDLDKRIKDYAKRSQKFTAEQIIEWITQMLYALQYMHNRHILHRDLKTSNIFLRSNVVKIGDFGISRILMGSADMASTFVGTPFFMSPEVLKHEGYNSKSDIWSVGCILYELATFQHAFAGTTLMGVMYKITEQPAPDFPPEYPKELEQLYVALMNKNPDGRPTANEALRFPVVINHLMLKGTIVERQAAKNKKDVVNAETEKIVHAFTRNAKLEDLQKESDDKRYRNLPPRDRLRMKKQAEAEKEAQRIASSMPLLKQENQARYEKARQQNNPYESTFAFGMEAANERRQSAGSPQPVNRHTAPLQKNLNSLETLSDDDDGGNDDVSDSTVTATPVRPGSTNRRYSDDDRPITPMKDKMIYGREYSSLDFPDGIPENPDLAETYYGQFEDEFNNSDEENLFTNMQSVLNAADGTLLAREKTLVADDKQAGAFGPGARDIKIKNLRAKLISSIGEEKLNEVYNYLKKVRFDDRKPGKEIDEQEISKALRRMVPDTNITFEIENLVFLENRS